jgi:dipeptidyl aminopeptidase/acylaminoacyl peptidase
VAQVRVSPDGSRVAYVLTVPRRPWADESGPAWRELHLVGPDGVARPFVTGEVSVSEVAWTREGAAIAFLAERQGDEEKALYAIPVAGGEARRLASHPSGIEEYAFAPDGRHLAFVARREEAEEREKAEEKGFDAVVYEERLRPHELYLAALDPAAGGVAGEPRRVELAGSVSDLAWSPAGDRIALALAPSPLVDDSYMAQRVKVVEVASGRVVAVIDNPGKLGRVEWSGDGRHLALISGVDLNDPREGRLTVVPAAGGALRDVLPGLRDEGHVLDFAWRGADALVYLAARGVRTEVGRVALDGGAPTVLVPPGETIWNQLSVPREGAGFALVADAADHPGEVFWSDGSGAPRRLTDSNPWLAERRLAPQEVVSFAARDGLELEAVLIRPLDERRGERHPLILAVHGGPESHHTDGWLTSYSQPGQVAAARGFAVLYTNYRGSTGRGVEFSVLSQGDPAGREFDDLVDAVDHLVATGLADRARVGVTGGSYGGYATAWLATRHSERFAAAVMAVGLTNLTGKLGTSDIPRELYLVHTRHWPWEDYALMLERSPISYVEEARTPLLILHGEDDTRVHPSQSLQLYRYLEVLGKTSVRLVLYPGEGHGNRKSAGRLDFNLRMLRWFEHYLAGPGGEPPPPDLDYALPAEWTEGSAGDGGEPE